MAQETKNKDLQIVGFACSFCTFKASGNGRELANEIS
jgi:hypothetical protein